MSRPLRNDSHPLNPLSPRTSYSDYSIPISPRIAADENKFAASGIAGARRSVNANYPASMIRVAEKMANALSDAGHAEVDAAAAAVAAEHAKAIAAPPAGQCTPRMMYGHEMKDPDLQSLKAREMGGLGAKMTY